MKRLIERLNMKGGESANRQTVEAGVGSRELVAFDRAKLSILRLDDSRLTILLPELPQ
jgi:hypothetical protein